MITTTRGVFRSPCTDIGLRSIARSPASSACLHSLYFSITALHPLQSLVTSVFGHFGLFSKTEMTEDRSDQEPK